MIQIAIHGPAHCGKSELFRAICEEFNKNGEKQNIENDLCETVLVGDIMAEDGRDKIRMSFRSAFPSPAELGRAAEAKGYDYTESMCIQRRRHFRAAYEPTSIPSITVDVGRNVRIWDCGGRKSFAFIPIMYPQFHQNMEVIWLCYDASDLDTSLKNLEDIVSILQLGEGRGKRSSCVIFLLALKTDIVGLAAPRPIIDRWCMKNGIQPRAFWKVSTYIPGESDWSVAEMIKKSLQSCKNS